ncbi:MAG: pilus assembly protein TadG-related protein [Pseudomonadota bacterium]
MCRTFMRPHRQQGAIGIMAVGVLFLVVICIVLALDTGRLYMQKQNLQRVADLAALDTAAGAGLLDGTAKAGIGGLARESAALNGFSPEAGVREVAVAQGDIEFTEDRKQFVAAADGSGPAVRVEARQRVPTSLVANLAALMPDSDLSSHTWLQADAVAQQKGAVTFSAGSSLLTADLSGSPLLGPVLQGLLGSEVDIEAVSFTGLADVGVSLLDLIDVAPGVGTLDELLDLELGIGGDDGLVRLVLTALQTSSKGGELLALETQQALDELAKANLEDIQLGDILAVNAPAVGRQRALETLVSVGDLLNAGILLANQGESAVSINDLELDVGRLVNVELDLDVIEPPEIAVGPPGCAVDEGPPCSSSDGDGRYWATQADNAQLDLQLGLSLELLGLASLDVGLDVEGAEGVAGVERLERLAAGEYDVEVGGVTTAASVDADVNLALLPAFDGLLTLDVDSTTDPPPETVAGGHVTERLDPPWRADVEAPQSVTLSSGVAGVADLLDNLLSGLDIDIRLGPDAEEEASCSGLLGCLVGGVSDLLAPVLDTVNDLLDVAVDDLTGLTNSLGSLLGRLTSDVLGPLLEPLLEGLGIGVADMEVEVIDVEAGGAELVL